MSQKNAELYLQELGVEGSIAARNDPRSLPLTLDCLVGGGRSVATETYERFASLASLLPDSPDANSAYRALGKELFEATQPTPARSVELGSHDDVEAFLSECHKVGSIALLLDGDRKTVLQGLRPQRSFLPLRRIWNVAGPFLFDVVSQPDEHRRITSQVLSRESTGEVIRTLPPANTYAFLLFSGKQT